MYKQLESAEVRVRPEAS